MIGQVEVSDGEIVEAVAAVEGEMLELLSRLVAAPTTLGNEEPGQEIMEAAFRDLLGLEPGDITMDAELLRSHPQAAPFSWDVSEKRNVVADWPAAGTGGRSLVLQGHIDVVGPASERLWRTPPFAAVRDGDWLYGRGSGDMKAGLAAIVGAVLGLRRLGLAPLSPVQLQSVVEEECGGNGALQCVLSGLRPDAAVIPEPYSRFIPTSQVGVLWFHIDIAGTPAHVADAQAGFNAIEASFAVVTELHALEDELNESPPPPFDGIPHPINFNVGMVSGGDWASTVAAECTLSCRIAHYPGTPVSALQRRVEEAVARAAAASAYLTEHPPTVRYDGFACDGSHVAADEPVVQALSTAWEAVTGTPAVTGPTTATTDVRPFIAAGIPAACIGPHAERIHGVDERVLVPSVVQTAQVRAPRSRLVRPRVTTQPLQSVSEIRRFFRTAKTPVYFVSATAFNLLGIDRWMPTFRYLNYYDSFDGYHPNVFVPRHHSPPLFESIEEICNYLLGHKDTHHFIRENGPGGKAVFLMFDEETEGLAEDAGLDVAFPPASLRTRLDSKLETTRLADEASVPSVPNVLGRADSYGALLKLALGAGLGQDLVLQTAYGDSGQTTFFVANAADWDEHAGELVGNELKIMKRIDCREAAIEGVITRHGTLVGPLMTELTGFPELTPYGGGWCGNDIFATALTERHRSLAREYTQRMGDRLRDEGYRGYFELDVLADIDSGELYLGELNPRVTGASSMTNVTAVAYGDMPLFLFHLLEFADVDYEIDVQELNDGWSHPGAVDEWSQFILKQTEADVEQIVHAPRSGIWRLDSSAPGGIRFVRRETDWHDVSGEEEAFYLRIAAEGQYRYPGADLGILVTRGRLQTDEHDLTERALDWISGIKSQFAGVPAPLEAELPPPEPFSFKML